MVLKAVFVEFSGVMIRDADLKKSLINEILIAENLRPNDTEYDQICKGSSDRACLEQLLNRRGRVTNQELLDKLLSQKSKAYTQQLSAASKLPLYPGLEDLLYKIKTNSLALGLVTSTAKAEVDWVLEQANLTDAFSVVVTAQDLTAEAEKPSPEAYQVAIARLNDQLPGLNATPEECLAVEAFYSGIAAAKSARVPVLGVAHCYPYRMIQRRADWVVDYLNEIDFDWIGRAYEPAEPLAVE
jgi:beta-phosphoglucomutase-like phosphatase (HAD superfamily)